MSQTNRPLQFRIAEIHDLRDASRASRVEAIKQCLDYLQAEATEADLKLLAHLISVAAEYASEYTSKTTH